MNTPKYHSRKLFVAIMLETLATTLLVMGLISSEEWVQVTGWVAAGYFLSQGYVDSVERGGPKAPSIRDLRQ